MRRAIPYPCSGPRACSVFSTIKASVPCQTSARSPIVSSCRSYGIPISICYSPYGNAIEETKDPAILFPVFFLFFRLPFLTLPKLPTSLIRLPLRLPGDGCPFNAFARSLACVPISFLGVPWRSALRLCWLSSVLRQLSTRRAASRNTSPFAAPRLSLFPVLPSRTPLLLFLEVSSRLLEKTLPFPLKRG